MGSPNNDSIPGSEKLARLQKAGKFLKSENYDVLSASGQYAVDREFEQLPPDAEPPMSENSMGGPDLRCMGCGTVDPKAFDDLTSDRCVACEEEGELHKDEDEDDTVADDETEEDE